MTLCGGAWKKKEDGKMKKQLLYTLAALVVLSNWSSVNPARADLTLAPLAKWEITGNFGDILSLNGIPVSSLIFGTSTFASPPGSSPNEPAEGADDFSLRTAACADGQALVKTVFGQPVITIFMLEKKGNDSGTIQGLDASGNPVGGPVAFSGTQGPPYWTDTGYLASFLSTQQNAFGMTITSDIPIYGILITAPGIDPVSILAVPESATLYAFSPHPADGEVDVSRDVVLSWRPASSAANHDVYFGTVLADVNAAGETNPLGVLVKQGQDANSYSPVGPLKLDQTYYWRVDEVNNVESGSPWKGNVWSFTTEPVGYPIRNITATASSSDEAGGGPESTINGSGLSATDLHSTETTTMWLSSSSGPQPPRIQYEFDKAYKLHEMWVWNYNGQVILTGLGFRNATIEYSIDGANWTQLGGVHEFAKASGKNDYAYNTTVALGGVVAKYVRVTPNSNWSGGMLNQYGLSEVRFLYIPTYARNPDPASGATDVDLDVVLNWRAGREAASHKVYFTSDRKTVIDGTAPGVTVSESSYAPGPLPLGKTYYWRVDEVNEAATPASWKGDVWAFSTWEYLVVDDFEDYNDYPPHRIFQIWLDGLGFTQPAPGYPSNGTGSAVGNSQPPYAERTIVHSGQQSMPLGYDNTGATGKARYSETHREWATPQDWTRNGVRSLSLWFRGDPNNAAERMYVAVANKTGSPAVVYHDDPSAVKMNTWQEWNIDLKEFADQGVDLTNVSRIAVGFGNRTNPQPGGSGNMYLDDIRLYASRCIPSIVKPAGDLNNDCVVDYLDLDLMADNWLLGVLTFSANAEEIWLEAESANTISSPLRVWSDRTDASGGQYITVDAGNNSTAAPPDTGVASYVFTVKGGIYKILGRVITLTNTVDDDSCWIRIQKATTQTKNHSSGWVRWNDIAWGQNWHWDEAHSSDDGNQTVRFTMTAGTYTLEFAYREDGLLLDRLLITNNLNLDQATLPPLPADLNEDRRIDFKDFAKLAGSWLEEQLWP